MTNRSRSTDPRLTNLPDEKISAEEATAMAGVGLFHIKLIIISGFVWMARGFELVVMRFVIHLQSCEWKLELWQGALLNTITLFSTILGCILYGIWSDKYGRKKAFYSLLFLFIFGSISAAAPTFTWFIIFRVVAAFSVGGLYQTLVLCCELFPGGKRGRVVYTLSTFWALSVLIMQYVLFSTMIKGYSWKLFVIIGTLPALLAICLVKFYPESFRYQMVKEKYAAANDTMAKMLKGNGKKVTAQLLQLPQGMTRKLVLDIFRKPFLRYFTWLLILGLLTSICYRSSVNMWLQTLLQWRYINLTDEYKFSNILFMIDMDRSIECFKLMDLEEFKFITWTTALDYPAFVIYLILSDWINRKILLTASYVLSLISYCLLFPFPLLSLLLYNFDSEEILFMIFSFFSRTILLGQHDLILLIVAETFPTSHRGTAVGLEVAIFYLGQFLGFYLSQKYTAINAFVYMYNRMFTNTKQTYREVGFAFLGPISYVPYCGMTLFCAIGCWKGLEETTGKELKDIIESPPDENVEEN